MSPQEIGPTCGQGCGRPMWKDGYCSSCWNLANLTGYPSPIEPIKAEIPEVDDIPDHFPLDWTR